MLAVLLVSALSLSNGAPLHAASDIRLARTAYRDCIADFIAGRPKGESTDQALAVALEQCHDAEIALRAACKSAPGNTIADTVAILLDTRLDGEEAGLKRRDAHQ